MLTPRGHVKTRARASESSVELPAVSVRASIGLLARSAAGNALDAASHAVGKAIRVMTFVNGRNLLRVSKSVPGAARLSLAGPAAAGLPTRRRGIAGGVRIGSDVLRSLWRRS